MVEVDRKSGLSRCNREWFFGDIETELSPKAMFAEVHEKWTTTIRLQIPRTDMISPRTVVVLSDSESILISISRIKILQLLVTEDSSADQN